MSLAGVQGLHQVSVEPDNMGQKVHPMSPDQYYCAEIREGPNSRRFYFYASVQGLTGPEYGYTEDHAWIDQAYESALHEVLQRFSVEPRSSSAASVATAQAGVVVSVSEPHVFRAEELVRLDPWVNVYVVNAIKLAKRELGHAFHPIRVVWRWQTSEEPEDEAVVYLMLSDETGKFGEGFSLQQLRNESLVKDRIRRLYQDLLELRSRTLIMNLLRGDVGPGKD